MNIRQQGNITSGRQLWKSMEVLACFVDLSLAGLR
jgi:hypothetical protein